MLGVILCGGQSSRMGADKALLKLQDNTWAQTAIDKINSLQLPVVLSVNTYQYSDYACIFSCPLVTDNNSLLLKGPLAAVLSVHMQYPAEDLLIVACDMPLLESSLLKELLVNCEQHPDNDAFVYTNDAEPEPLCGIYKSKALAYILHLYHTDDLPKHSMKYMLDHIKPHLIPLQNEQKIYFRNFNAHADLNGL